MKYLELIDNYNEDKVWCVKVYSGGQVYFNQKIKGILFNSRYQRTTKKYLNETLERNINEIIANDEREDEPMEILDREGNDIFHDNKDVYSDLFSKIHQEENNPYMIDDELLPF